MSSKTMTYAYTERSSDGLEKLGGWLDSCDSIVIGAGAGLSTSAGMTYDGPRFEDNFGDFIAKYGYGDLYRASFQRYESLEEQWAFWSRMIMLNRYEQEDNGTYSALLDLVGTGTTSSSPQTWTTVSRSSDSIRSACTTHRGITGSGSVPNPAIHRRTTTRVRSGGWSRSRGT